MTTLVLVATLVGSLVLSIAVWVALLRVGLRWAKVPDVTGRKVALTAVLVFVVSFVVIGLVKFLEANVPVVSVSLSVITELLMPILVIGIVFRTALTTAVKVWLPTLLHTVFVLAMVALVVQPFILEGYKNPSNPMAPTLLGKHWEAVCEDCGAPAYGTPSRGAYDENLMICRDHFHITEPVSPPNEVHQADQFLIAKYLKPQRWDIVVFRFPRDPSTPYVMRLVGLPGEEITIRDGRVFANGVALELPDSLKEITYSAPSDEAGYYEPWGTEQNPAKLAEDEYFVLGDFTRRSNDSRFWHEGAPGHAPYAVPADHMMGVVTHIYWPISRWRCFR